MTRQVRKHSTAHGAHQREATALETRLRALGTSHRAAGAQAYLKSHLAFAGNDAATVRREVKRWQRTHPDMPFEELVERVDTLWRRGVFELRTFGLELLVGRAAELRFGHLSFLERLLRDSHTWALVDTIAPRLVGALLGRRPAGVGRVLERWARDDDFWIRRAALLALLLPIRRGAGNWRRFNRLAGPLVDDDEFFVRKAIGWLLREAAPRQPAQVIAFVEPRAHRLSGVTWREAVRKLPPHDRQRLERLRRSSSARPGRGRRTHAGGS